MKSHWLYNKWFELLWIMAPPFLCLLAIMIAPQFFINKEVNHWWWIILILIMDVGHVYTTLYRTYFDPSQRNSISKTLLIVPILCFSIALLGYQFGERFFWSIMAYLAIFHFIKQQYGFVKVYSRKDDPSIYSKIDIIAVYAACIYPMVYWHAKGPFEFDWFAENDLVFIKSNILLKMSHFIYLVIIATYMISCVVRLIQQRFNLPVALIILGTFVSWYFGIVYYKSDLTFTLLNVASHGVPYMAIVWIFAQKTHRSNNTASPSWLKYIFTRKNVALFLFIPLGFAFLEEGLWDVWIWKEHQNIFSMFNFLKGMTTDEVKMLIVPILAMPQLTHYVLDGFIWKVSKGHVNV